MKPVYDNVKLLNARLDEESKRFLNDIYEPTKVYGGGLEAAWSGLCVTRDGRIRFYSPYNKKSVYDTNYEMFYVESDDCGISWKKHMKPKNSLGASVYIPFTDKYMGTRQNTEGEDSLTCVYIGDDPDDENVRKIVLSEKTYVDLKQPFVLKKRNRIIVSAQEMRPELHPSAYFPVLFYSDDGGETWRETHPGAAPFAESKWPHKGYRWQQNNREQTLAELCDGTLLMITRTACDFHFMSKSYDGGETWSEFTPSPFHSTATMPVLKKLSDGRLLFFWCNTKPLPELDGADGVWEDVFTNRDVCHCAISEDDGKTWIGFRELRLNPLRNSADFRSVGGPEMCRDKSVHQFEVLELPNNKILFVNGQHPVCCGIYIFDIRWLYERERHEDFIHGLSSLTVHTYVKGIIGENPSTPDDPNKYSGHCAYNRTNCSFLLPNPEDERKEALFIRRDGDDILTSGIGGAVWNFPSAKRGMLSLRAYIPGKGLRVSLLDYWMNPGDDTAEYFADMSIVIRRDMQPHGEVFSDFTIEFDCDNNKAVISCGDYFSIEKNLGGAHPNGLSYLHMQSAATEEDYEGAYIERIDFESK